MLEPVSSQVTTTPASDRSVIGGLGERQTPLPEGEPSPIPSRSLVSENSLNKNSVFRKDSFKISAEARETTKLENRDREVRAHEAAHAVVGRPPALTYKRGPGGRSYTTCGEVEIDLSPVTGDPLGTLQRAEVIRSSALAPFQPSAQDMRVASRVASMATETRAALVTDVNQQVDELSVSNKSDTLKPSSSEIHHSNRAVRL